MRVVGHSLFWVLVTSSQKTRGNGRERAKGCCFLAIFEQHGGRGMGALALLLGWLWFPSCAAARAALEKFGELPQDVLEGTRRSRFAPPIVRRGGLQTKNDSTSAPEAVDIKVTASSEAESAVSDNGEPA